MEARHSHARRGLLGADSIGAAVAVLAAAVVTRAARPDPADALASPARVALEIGLVALGLLAVVECAAAFFRARASPGPATRSEVCALARIGVSLVAALAASASSHDGGGARIACLAALGFVALALPAAPLPGGRLLEGMLAHRMPQMVAARLAARVGFTAALVGPAALLLLQRIRADTPALTVLAVTALLLLAGVRKARDDAFVRELRLQARRADSGLTQELRAELLAAPLDPEIATLRALSPEQFRPFRGDCERCYARR